MMQKLMSKGTSGEQAANAEAEEAVQENPEEAEAEVEEEEVVEEEELVAEEEDEVGAEEEEEGDAAAAAAAAEAVTFPTEALSMPSNSGHTAAWFPKSKVQSKSTARRLAPENARIEASVTRTPSPAAFAKEPFTAGSRSVSSSCAICLDSAANAKSARLPRQPISRSTHSRAPGTATRVALANSRSSACDAPKSREYCLKSMGSQARRRDLSTCKLPRM
mmetsp:Transcript_142134/g.246166  ORF Transcript_142134/g.246166 Transcript_142134/m.246166 type:complete len:220 (-) Transcript_142134:240-899(-)